MPTQALPSGYACSALRSLAKAPGLAGNESAGQRDGETAATGLASPGTVLRVHRELLFRNPCRTGPPKALEFCGFPYVDLSVPKPLVFGIQQSVNPIRSFFLKAGDHMAISDVVPWVVERWHDFPEFGGYLGNVG